ncbi:protein MpROS1a [Marchantia polymorpha subsp. ruderalis]
MELIPGKVYKRRQQQRLNSRSPPKGSAKYQRKKDQLRPADQIVAVFDPNAADGDGLRTSRGKFLYGRPTSGSLAGAGDETEACIGKLQRSIKRQSPEILVKWVGKKRRNPARVGPALGNLIDFGNTDGNTPISSDAQKLEKDPSFFSRRRDPRRKVRAALRVLRLQDREGSVNLCGPKMISNDSTTMVALMDTCPKTLPQSPVGPVTPVPSKQKKAQKRKSLYTLGDVADVQQVMMETHSPARRKLFEPSLGALILDVSERRDLFYSQEDDACSKLPCASRSLITVETSQVTPGIWMDPALECRLEDMQNACEVAHCYQTLNPCGLLDGCEGNIGILGVNSNFVHSQGDSLTPTQQPRKLQDILPSISGGYNTDQVQNVLDISKNVRGCQLCPTTPVKFSVPKKSRSKVKPRHQTQQGNNCIVQQPRHCLNVEHATPLRSVESLEFRSETKEQDVLFDLNEPPLPIRDEPPMNNHVEPPDKDEKISKRKHRRPRVLKDVTKPVRVPRPKKTPIPRKGPHSKPRRTKKTDAQAAQMKHQGGFVERYNVSEGQADRRVPEYLLREDSLGSMPKPRRMRVAARLRRSLSLQVVREDSVVAVESVAVGIADLQLLNSSTTKAIVLHSSNQRAIVPYAKPRLKVQKPKVQLGDDDLQWWKLVMTHGPTYEDKNDEKTEEKWAKQRFLFKMRADNFIQVMHAVQGNRRFSKWKGSVIDSIVGAFLTQNVSDHLSSSAFMLLASRFPVSVSSTCGHNIYKEVSVEETFDSRDNYTDATPLRMRDADKDYLVEEPTAVEDPPLVQEPPVVEIPSTPEELEEEHRDFWHSTPIHSGEKSQINRSCEHQFDHDSSPVVNSKISGDFKIRDEFGVEIPSIPNGQQEVEDKDSLIPNDPEGAVENPLIDLAQSIGADNISSDEILSTLEEKTDKVSYIGLTGSERARLEQNKTNSKDKINWEEVRKSFADQSCERPQTLGEDAVDWETVRTTDVHQIADVIKERGMNNMLAGRIKGFLDRVQIHHGSLDLEWLRTIPPEQAKKFLLSIHGLGLKSAECVRLLTLHHLAFPVDTNVGRICVRLGWVPIEPLPEVQLLSELETYPVQENIQKYLWPRLCTLDQLTLYELHYQMITFGKVFCTKRDPNCHACPLRNDCQHYADAMTRTRKPEITSTAHWESRASQSETLALHAATANLMERLNQPTTSTAICEPIIEEPSSPTRNSSTRDDDIIEVHDEGNAPGVIVQTPEFPSHALVVVPPDVASKPVPKLKSVGRLRTVHYVYELKDDHPLMHMIGARVEDDPCPILLAIWGPGESPDMDVVSNDSQDDKVTDNFHEGKEETVKGTLLVPCRTANRGIFPLNGTYFQVNEVFADHETSINPIEVPRKLLWDLTRRFVYFGTSVTSIFKGLNVDEISYAFQCGYVCVRGFDNVTRAPKPLQPRLHSAASLGSKRRQQQPKDTGEINGHNAKAQTKRKQKQKVSENTSV